MMEDPRSLKEDIIDLVLVMAFMFAATFVMLLLTA